MSMGSNQSQEEKEAMGYQKQRTFISYSHEDKDFVKALSFKLVTKKVPGKNKQKLAPSCTVS
jgi:hypothetical protein